MIKKFDILAILCLLIVFILVSGCTTTSAPATQSNVQNRSISTENGAVMYPVMKETAADYMGTHPGDRIYVNNTGTSALAIKLLLANKTDVATTSRAATDSEIAAGEKAGIDLHMTMLGADAVCVLVNPSNPVDDLNLSQLNDIFYSGNVTNWTRLTNGTKAGPIHVYAVDAGVSGVSSQFNLIVNGSSSNPFVAGYTRKGTQTEIVPAVMNDPDAISFTSLQYVNSSVKTVKVNGITPSKQTVLDTTYPITLRVYAITNGEPTGLTKDLLNYQLSIDGQNILEEQGLIPIE